MTTGRKSPPLRPEGSLAAFLRRIEKATLEPILRERTALAERIARFFGVGG